MKNMNYLEISEFKIKFSGVEIELSIETVKALMKSLNGDEIFDSIKEAFEERSLLKSEIFTRIKSDFKEELSDMLCGFFKSQEETEWNLLNQDQQDQLQEEYSEWLGNL